MKSIRKIKSVDYAQFLCERMLRGESRKSLQSNIPSNIATPAFNHIDQQSKKRIIQGSYIRIPIEYREWSSGYEPDEADTHFIGKCKEYVITKVLLSDEEFIEQIVHLELLTELTLYQRIAIEPGRRFIREFEQLEKMKNNPISSRIAKYYYEKRTQLKRPLLRIFMRAVVDDPRVHMTFRPSEPKRFRREQSIPLPSKQLNRIPREFRKNEQYLSLIMKSLLEREKTKKYLLVLDRSLWQAQLDPQSIHPQSKEIEEFSSSLTNQIIQAQDLLTDTISTDYSDCNVSGCNHRLLFTEPLLNLDDPLIALFERELEDIRSRGVKMLWPKWITQIRETKAQQNGEKGLVVNEWNTLGLSIGQGGLRMGTLQKTVVIRKKEKLKCNLTLVMQRSSETKEVSNLDFDHLKVHGQTAVKEQTMRLQDNIMRLRRSMSTSKQSVDQFQIIIDEDVRDGSNYLIDLDESNQKQYSEFKLEFDF